MNESPVDYWKRRAEEARKSAFSDGVARAHEELTAALTRAYKAEAQVAALREAYARWDELSRAPIGKYDGPAVLAARDQVTAVNADAEAIAIARNRELRETEWKTFFRLLFEECDPAHVKAGKSGPQFESGAQKAEDYAWARIAIGARLDAYFGRIEAELEEARSARDGLLAIIHRDGGQYTEQHGVAKSVDDAHAAWGAMVLARDEALAKLEVAAQRARDSASNSVREVVKDLG